MTERTETQNTSRLYLRIPSETREKLQRLAKKQKRSLQGQAELLIEEGLRAMAMNEQK